MMRRERRLGDSSDKRAPTAPHATWQPKKETVTRCAHRQAGISPHPSCVCVQSPHPYSSLPHPSPRLTNQTSTYPASVFEYCICTHVPYVRVPLPSRTCSLGQGLEGPASGRTRWGAADVFRQRLTSRNGGAGQPPTANLPPSSGGFKSKPLR